MNIYGEYFYGNKISDYGLQNGYVDYSTLAKAFDAVLNNNIIENTYDIGYWEQESGVIDNDDAIEEVSEKIEALEARRDDLEEKQSETEDDNYFDLLAERIEEVEHKIEALEKKRDDLEDENGTCDEIFQYYIVDDRGADLLKEINEIVFYNDALDMYVWGVTHYGTAWSYVLTNIPCNTGKFE